MSVLCYLIFDFFALYSHSASLHPGVQMGTIKYGGKLMKPELSAGPIGHLACIKAYLPSAQLIKFNCTHRTIHQAHETIIGCCQ